MRGYGDSNHFFQHGRQCGGETISAGLGGKGYLDCLLQEPDCLVLYEMYGLVMEV